MVTITFTVDPGDAVLLIAAHELFEAADEWPLGGVSASTLDRYSDLVSRLLFVREQVLSNAKTYSNSLADEIQRLVPE